MDKISFCSYLFFVVNNGFRNFVVAITCANSFFSAFECRIWSNPSKFETGTILQTPASDCSDYRLTQGYSPPPSISVKGCNIVDEDDAARYIQISKNAASIYNA